MCLSVCLSVCVCLSICLCLMMSDCAGVQQHLNPRQWHQQYQWLHTGITLPIIKLIRTPGSHLLSVYFISSEKQNRTVLSESENTSQHLECLCLSDADNELLNKTYIVDMTILAVSIHFSDNATENREYSRNLFLTISVSRLCSARYRNLD